jgi:hypothetical protein
MKISSYRKTLLQLFIQFIETSEVTIEPTRSFYVYQIDGIVLPLNITITGTDESAEILVYSRYRSHFDKRRIIYGILWTNEVFPSFKDEKWTCTQCEDNLLFSNLDDLLQNHCIDAFNKWLSENIKPTNFLHLIEWKSGSSSIEIERSTSQTIHIDVNDEIYTKYIPLFGGS